MKTRTIRRHLVPALFTCGMLSLTTGIVAATVQGNDPNTHSENPPAAPTTPAPNRTQTAEQETTDENGALAEKILAEQQPDAATIQATSKTALAWLALVDQGKYNESYKQLLPEVKSHISPNEWTKYLGSCRKVAKKEIKRKQITDSDSMYSIASWQNVSDSAFALPIPKTPPSYNYRELPIMIQFETLLPEEDTTMIETALVQRRDNGSYKVAGYYVQLVDADPSSDTAVSQTTDPAHGETATKPITFPDTEPRCIILDETGKAYYNALKQENTETRQQLEKGSENTLAWLTLIDLGEYKSAYKQVVDQIKSTQVFDIWAYPIENAPYAAQKAVTRTLSSVAISPNAYTVYTYKTTFADKKTVKETVTQVKQSDGQWKFANYRRSLITDPQ